MRGVDISAALGAGFITGAAALTNVIVSGVRATTTGTETDLFTSLGVFGAALAIAYYMLRRGDKREKDLLELQHADDLQTAASQAILMDRYVAALESLAASNAKVAELERDLRKEKEKS